jgi:uncharacterized OB-fold protein
MTPKPTTKKDFIQTECKNCGRVFMQPYHSIQKNPPVAPTWKELKGTQERLLADLMWHQNKECRR